MSRQVPWRNKPTNLITQMLPVAAQYKLYLVHEIGPTSFVFKDDHDNKFKVNIGASLSCSCGIVQNDHCIHTLYVMLKKFKVPPTHSIIWQTSYLDSELEGLIHHKYAQKPKLPPKKFQPKKKYNPTTQNDNDFPPLQEDAMCPICYEQMTSQCYSTCTMCKKSLHTKCFKVWTRHKEDSGMNVTCPMCRNPFSNPMVIIYKDFEKWQQRFSTHKGTLCKGCGMKHIKGLIYKCLLCNNTDLCKMCYEGNQHSEHERFFVKQLASDPWRVSPIRNKKTRKQLFHPIKQIVIKELSVIKEQELIQFIVDLFPTLKEFTISQASSELGIVGNDLLSKQLCFHCKSAGNQLMLRLTCGHSLHQNCLKQKLGSKDYECELDNAIICPGFLQAMGIKVEKKKKKNVSVTVLKNEQQIDRISHKMNRMQITNNSRNKTIGKKIQTPNNNNKIINLTGSSLNSLNSRSKDKNFRIMKKTVDRKNQQNANLITNGGNLGSFMIIGYGNQPAQETTSTLVTGKFGLPPRMKQNKGSQRF